MKLEVHEAAPRSEASARSSPRARGPSPAGGLRAGRRWRGRILLLAALAGVALAELGMRTYIVRFADQLEFSRYASLRQVLENDEQATFARHTYLGFYPRPGLERRFNRHNQLGFRGEEFPRAKPLGEFRIACIGESTTYDTGVWEHELSYPAMLQKVLHQRGHGAVRVINAGCNAWTTYESLINLHLRVLDLEPDLLLISHSLTDIHARLVWPPERYLGDNSGFRGTTAEVFMPSALEHSALWRFLAVNKGWMTPHATLERSHRRQPPWYQGNDFVHQVRAGVYPSGFFRRVPAQAMLDANPPIYYRRNLTEMVRTARQREIDSVLVSFHYLDADPRSLSGTPEYRQAYLEHEEVQRRVAEEEGAFYFDLHAVFPAEQRYFTDDVHLNVEGSRLKAILFADYLEAQGLLPG